MPICKCVQNSQECQWCAECGDKGLWSTTHNTAAHIKGFERNRSSNTNGNSKSKVQFAGEANIGEGLVPDMGLWLAEINSSKATVQGSKRSPKKLKKNSKKHKQLSINDCLVLNRKTNANNKLGHSSCAIQVFIMFMLTSTALSIDWFQIILMWKEHTVHLQQVNHWNLAVIIGKQLQLAMAPTLWFILGVLASDGRSILHCICPNTITEEMQPMNPRNAHRECMKDSCCALCKCRRCRTHCNTRSDP